MGLCASSPTKGHDRISKHHFRVERVVGQGGFGVVNAVIKETPPLAGETFAMKSLRKHVILERNHTEMVFRERNLLARLRHPRLVNMHYAFQDEAHLYIIMDACLGGDLHYQIMQSPTRRFTEMQTKFYAVCILQALEYMHENGVLHRDIKPENLLLDERGQLRITDLGVSGELDSAGHCFSTSGTRPYMAPEVFMSGHKHGKASDFYSLGITLHQFLTGQRPYRASRTNLKTIVRMAAFVPPDTVHTRSHARRVLASAQERRSHSEEFALSRRLRAHSDACADFVKGLLVCNAQYRLGSTGFKEVYEHPWLADMDLEAVRNETARAPFVPDMSRAQCNVYDSDLARLLLSGDDSAQTAPTLLAEEQAKFEGYDYNTSMKDVSALDPASIQTGAKAPQIDTRTRTDVTMASSIQSNGMPAPGHRPASRISAAEAGAAPRRSSAESHGKASLSSAPPLGSSAAGQVAPSASRLPIEGGALQAGHGASAEAAVAAVSAAAVAPPPARTPAAAAPRSDLVGAVNSTGAGVGVGATSVAASAEEALRGSHESDTANPQAHPIHAARPESRPTHGTAYAGAETGAREDRLSGSSADGPATANQSRVGAPPLAAPQANDHHRQQPQHGPRLAPQQQPLGKPPQLQPPRSVDAPSAAAAALTAAHSPKGGLRSVKSAGSIAMGRAANGLSWPSGCPPGAPAAEPNQPTMSQTPPVAIAGDAGDGSSAASGANSSSATAFIGHPGPRPARSASTNVVGAVRPALPRVHAGTGSGIGTGSGATPIVLVGNRTPVGSAASIVDTSMTASGSSFGLNHQASLAGRTGLESRAASYINNGSSVRSMPEGGADVVSAVVSRASMRSPPNEMGFGSPLGTSAPTGLGFSSTRSGSHRAGEPLSSQASSPSSTNAGDSGAPGAGTHSDFTTTASDLQSRVAPGMKLAPFGTVSIADINPTNMTTAPSHHDLPAAGAANARFAAQPSSGSLANDGSFNMVPHAQTEFPADAAGADPPTDAALSDAVAVGARLGPLPPGPPPATAGRVNLPAMRSFPPHVAHGAQLDVLAELTNDDRSPSGSEGGGSATAPMAKTLSKN